MSLLAITKAFAIQELKGSYKLVFIALADNCNDNYECYPSYPTIAKKASICVRTAIRTIKKLEEMGYLKIKKESQKSNFYKLNFEPKSIKIPSDKMSPPVKMTLAEPVSNCYWGSDTYDTGVVTPVSPESPINQKEEEEEKEEIYLQFAKWIPLKSKIQNLDILANDLKTKIINGDMKTVKNFALFKKSLLKNEEGGVKEPTNKALERLQNLKKVLNSLTANELMRIDETAHYPTVFDTYIINYVVANGGLRAIQHRVFDDNNEAYLLSELGGAA